jgi:hypothetical protein
MEAIGIAIIFSLVWYFLPTIVAHMRGKDNVGGIFIINLLTGWTGIGWFVALVMACLSNKIVMVQQ